MTSDPERDSENIESSDDSEDDPGWPISFLLLVGAGALYLIIRVVQMVKGLVT
jgi:hypothetical protein